MSTFASVVRFSTTVASLLLAASVASAAPPSKEECVEAHGKGQDARESGQFSQAGKLFLTCAQSTCPALVQSDCARFADEIARLQPSVTFAARDSAQNDLPDTSVFIDGTQVATRLGDGKAHELDPGRHDVRFVHAGKEVTLNVVVNQGEKGRGLVGIFPASTPTAPLTPTPVGAMTATTTLPTPLPTPPAREPKRSAGPLVLTGIGAAAMVAGGVLIGVGLGKVPAACSLSTNECVAPPNDPVFATASSGVSMANAGIAVGGIGAAAVVGSLIWYFAQTPHASAPTTSSMTRSLTPWLGPQGAGLSLSGAL
jgi:hypothetical protein